ncbi:fimbria/pilus periplasmic chaperone [Serratia ureilytica]|uniref:fimbria/pilus periplasmic chaperone n=1 Tax=Serratia ureilytica TaxID=300181 RepID=UPI0020A14D7B|nr:fimbria/pilus periplasmic chaperone [Serratia ureilytica]
MTGLALSLFVLYYSTAHAGGISLGATRVIYPAGVKQVSLAVTNSDKNSRFLIQSWIENADEKKSADFVLTPPLFVSKPNSENTLRIMHIGPELPKDRETVFWLNSKAIPAVERGAIEGKNVLQIAILSRIKLFFRPQSLPSTPADAPKQLRFSLQGNTLNIDNPSPYYVTLVNLNIGSHKLPNTMVPPKSNSKVSLPEGASGSVTYQTVNDYGANTPVTTVKLS